MSEAILEAILRDDPPAVIHLIVSGRMEWNEMFTLYEHGSIFYDTIDVVGHPVLVPQGLAVPEGYVGWFGHNPIYCKGGPLDGEQVTVRYRAERRDVFEALSR